MNENIGGLDEVNETEEKVVEIEKKRKDVDRIEKSKAAQKEIVQKELEISSQADVLRNYYNEAVKERR